MKKMTVCEPKISNALLTNPGIGFIAAPELMNVDENNVRDNRGNPVAAYRFTADSRTWNHPDSGVFYCGGRWRDIEIAEGVFDWSGMDKKLAAAAEMGCTAVVRIAPYALVEHDDIPAWLRARWPEEPEVSKKLWISSVRKSITARQPPPGWNAQENHR